MEKEKRKGGLQPDGSWLMIDDPPPYSVDGINQEKPKEEPETDDKEDDM